MVKCNLQSPPSNEKPGYPACFDKLAIKAKQNNFQKLSEAGKAWLNTHLSFFKGTEVPITNLALWPSADDLELDDSQYRAIQMALTKEFAVIQGPPGTGKTYIGLKVNGEETLLQFWVFHIVRLELTLETSTRRITN